MTRRNLFTGIRKIDTRILIQIFMCLVRYDKIPWDSDEEQILYDALAGKSGKPKSFPERLAMN